MLTLIQLVAVAAVLINIQQPVLSSPAPAVLETAAAQYHEVTSEDRALELISEEGNRRVTRQARNCGCRATVYDNANYQGRRLYIFQQNAEFTNDYFDDRVESISLEGNCRWLFYEHANFLGSVSHLLHVGYYASSPSWGGSVNQVSSARALPPSGSVAIVLFEHANYQGRMVVLVSSSTHLPSREFSDHISSVIVVGGQWTLYEHSNYQGRQTTLHVGDYPNIHSSAVGGDSVSSVRRDRV